MKDEVKNGIILGIVVILIIVIVYFSTAIFMTGEIGNKKDKKTTTTVASANSTSDYDNRIMASTILSRTGDKYMVVIFSSKNASNELKDAIKNYSGDTKLYVVDTDEVVNKSLKSDTDNLNVQNINDLKVKESAILTITNSVITDAKSGGANIISTLK